MNKIIFSCLFILSISMCLIHCDSMPAVRQCLDDCELYYEYDEFNCANLAPKYVSTCLINAKIEHKACETLCKI